MAILTDPPSGTLSVLNPGLRSTEPTTLNTRPYLNPELSYLIIFVGLLTSQE